jgi:hypothetical protein
LIYSKKLEADVLTALARAPDAHLRFQPDDYRPDGTIIVYRDNLSETLHRRLYRQVIGPVPSGLYLKKFCNTDRCLNPHHYRLEKASRPPRATCPNGHPYTKANLLEGRNKCRTCKENRLAKRRKGVQRKDYCKQGHKLTPSNVYRWKDVRGRAHRRCKTCHLERVRAARLEAANH